MSNIEIVTWANIIIAILSCYMLGRNLKNVFSNPAYIFYLIFFIFYVLPIILDVLIMPCDYTYSYAYDGFIKSQNNIYVVIIYGIFVLYTQYVVLHKLKSIKSNNSQILSRKIKHYIPLATRYWLLAGGLIPIVATVVILRNFNMLYTFSWRELGLYSDSGSYNTIERFCYLGISCFAILLFGNYKRKVNIWRIISVLGVFCCICIQGKRASLFFAFIDIAIAIYFKLASTKTNHKKIIGIFASAVVIYFVLQGMFMYSMTVKIDRGYNPERMDIFYTTTRIDMLRDDRIKMVIYSQLYDDMTILDYPMQTFIMDATSIIPINYISNYFGISSPPYQTYFTCALTDGEHSPNLEVNSYNSWMTVSLFAELISNVGLILGIILCPILILWFAKKCIQQNSFTLRLLFAYSFVLLNLFDFTYVVVILEATLIASFIYKINHNNRKHSLKTRLRTIS